MALKSQAELYQILHIKVTRLLAREFTFATEPTRESLYVRFSGEMSKDRRQVAQHIDDQDSPNHWESKSAPVENTYHPFS